MRTLLATGTNRQVLADRLGVWASIVCIAHCLITPLLLSMSAVFAHVLPSEEWVHRTLAIVITMLGAIALISGYRSHRRVLVLCLMVSGVSFITFAACIGDMLRPYSEVGITFAGSVQMIIAHRLNHTFCRDCVCTRKGSKASS